MERCESMSDLRHADAAHVAVVIPCFNVAAYIADVVSAIPDFVRTIVIVDDGSRDGTRNVVERLTDPRVVRVLHERNQGVGAAMRSGYRAALDRGADICVKMDGDGQMAAAHLPQLLEPLLAAKADYAKGNRFREVGALAVMPRSRLLGNGMLSFLTKLVSGYWSVFDPTNGYTALRAEVLRKLDLEKLNRGYFFETNMLIELNIQRAVVVDVDIPARYMGEPSSLRLGAVLVGFPPLLVRGLARRFFWRYMIHDFNVLTICVLIGVPWILFGAIFGGYHWWRSIATGVPATTGTVIIATLPIILGFQCLLVAFILDMLYQPTRPLSQPLAPGR